MATLQNLPLSDEENELIIQTDETLTQTELIIQTDETLTQTVDPRLCLVVVFSLTDQSDHT